MKPTLTSKYGYKVCFKKSRDAPFTYRFLTHSYKQAVDIKRYYYHSPPPDDNDKLIISKWYILPITKKDIKSGIWREVPF